MRKQWNILAMMILIALLSTACSGAPAENSEANSSESLTEPQVVEGSVDEEITDAEPASEAVSQADQGSESEDPENQETGDAVPVTGQEIEHLVSPGVFVLASLQRVVDCNTGPRAANNADPLVAPDCDAWDINRYERPLDETGWGYLPEVDIVQVELGQDEVWIYSRIEFFMVGEDAPVLSGSYALEIDLNLDARGDLLVVVNNPAQNESGEWSADGVQVWQDANNDVGSQTAVLPDGFNSGDGYETILFDSGMGEDPDLAWARVHPEEANILELSFKKELLRGKSVFAWWAWASAAAFDPAGFDYSDTYSEDGFSGLDNTCAWMFGQAPIEMANMCPSIVVPQPESSGGNGTCSPPPGGCSEPGEVWIQEQCKCVVFN